MSKIKNEETIGLPHVPFIIMWMSIPAVAFSLWFMILILAEGAMRQANFLQQLGDFLWNMPQVAGILVGILVGGVAGIGQTWLLRQRYGSAPRYWRLVTIVGWGLAGNGIAILTDYTLQRDFGVYGVFAWFFIPVIFQTIALWSYVRSAWLYALAGTVAALISVAAFTLAYSDYGSIYGLVFGTLSHTFLTALTLIVLMARQRKVNMKADAA